VTERSYRNTDNMAQDDVVLQKAIRDLIDANHSASSSSALSP
jgi:hypothetical protein